MPPENHRPPGGSRPPNGHRKVAPVERPEPTTARSPEQQIALRLHDLFPASDRSHVTYRVGSERRRESDGKIVPAYRTVKQPVTVDHWRQHIEGKRPLSLALACDDGTSRCSVVDIDDYATSAVEIANIVRRRGLPFYVRQSKSGGAHVFAFHDVPTPVAEAEAFARGMAGVLGVENKAVEYFPSIQSPDSAPRCINMPFFGGGGGFVKITGAQMTAGEFVRNVSLVGEELRASLTRPVARRSPSRRVRAAKPAAPPVEISAEHAAMIEADSGKSIGISTDPDDIYDDDLYLECVEALLVIPPDIDGRIDRRVTWLRIGAGLYHAFGDAAGFELWNDWSKEGEKYNPETIQQDWIQARDKFRNQNVRAIFCIADEYNPRWRDEYKKALAARGKSR